MLHSVIVSPPLFSLLHHSISQLCNINCFVFFYLLKLWFIIYLIFLSFLSIFTNEQLAYLLLQVLVVNLSFLFSKSRKPVIFLLYKSLCSLVLGRVISFSRLLQNTTLLRCFLLNTESKFVFVFPNSSFMNILVTRKFFFSLSPKCWNCFTFMRWMSTFID